MNSLSDYMSYPGMDGTLPLVEISKAKNGWLVKVYNQYRDREVSPETKAAREAEALKQQEAYQTALKKQASIQAKAMIIGMQSVTNMKNEPWQNEDGEGNKQTMQDIEDLIGQETEGMGNRYPYATVAALVSPVETHLFLKREEMIAFVSGVLEPIKE